MGDTGAGTGAGFAAAGDDNASRSSFSDFKWPATAIGRPIVTVKSPAKSPAALASFTSRSVSAFGSPDSLALNVTDLSGGKSCFNAPPNAAKSGTLPVTARSSPVPASGLAMPPSMPIFAPATVTASFTIHSPRMAPVR